MVSDELMLKVENVSKVYRLGEIGGTTLRDELQRLGAKIRKKEDPTKKIGAKNYNKGEKFKALDNISFEVKKGERIGIIGHNGAGKSTLLKLISRVTGPTEGKIYLNGRVASMLEVGTGFHPELTGRENIYMNGAILGMTKKEIDAKIEDIIEFSEVRQFIDTPVKRYSSGMYVKLAFSVAAHLDSEIMIMDEVLAVGDLNYQQKCILKMSELSEKNGKTILYVSHNMSTIRQFCNRVIVLKHGRIVFDGDVEDGISIYSLSPFDKEKTHFLFSQEQRCGFDKNGIEILGSDVLFAKRGELKFSIEYKCSNEFKSIIFRFVFLNSSGQPIATCYSKCINKILTGINSSQMVVDISSFINGFYLIDFIVSSVEDGRMVKRDLIHNAVGFEIVDSNDSKFGTSWIKNSWGSIMLDDAKVEEE